MTTPTAIDVLTDAIQSSLQGRRPHVPHDPPAEGTVMPGGFKMPRGYIAQVGVRRSRPGAIDPHAAKLFEAWLGQVVEMDSEGIPNIPPEKCGIIGYSALKNRAYQTVPRTLAVVSGDNQSGPVSTRVSNPLVVIATGPHGMPLSGEEILFKVESGGGTFGGKATEVTRSTDSAGLAKVESWELGNKPGDNTVVASRRSDKNLHSVRFHATGTRQLQRLWKITGGDRLRGYVGAALSEEPEVAVFDVTGKPIAGVRVKFKVRTGAGRLGRSTSQEVRTDSKGFARSKPWTLGNLVGEQTVVATAAGMPQLEFSANAIVRETAGVGPDAAGVL